MKKSINEYNAKVERSSASRRWNKKVIFVGIVVILIMFTILKTYSEDKNQIVVNPSLIEIGTDDYDISIGFGLAEGEGDTTQFWNIFPMRIQLRSGSSTFNLSLNGLSFFAWRGINFGKEMTVTGEHSGDVISVGGKIIVNGTVQGNVWAFGADIELLKNSSVSGDVVAVGGEIETHSYVYIGGNKQSVPELNVPFIGLLTSPQSAETLQFIFELFSIILFLFILFFVVHFNREKLNDQVQILSDYWKGSLLYMLLSLIIIPVTIFLLIISIIGIFIIPVMFVLILILVYFGFMAVSVRVGQFFLKDTDSDMKLYLCGLLGFFIIKSPVIIGYFFSLLSIDFLIAIGGILKFLGALVLFVAVFLGFGSTLVGYRKKNS